MDKLIQFPSRPADLVIGERYLSRWYLIPRNRFLNIYLHEYTGDDADEALHDHPWYSLSVLLKGKLAEWDQRGDVRIVERFTELRFRSARYAHRLELITSVAYTLFITGPVIREWGFHCPKGWRHWKQFTNFHQDGDSSRTGIGCGEH